MEGKEKKPRKTLSFSDVVGIKEADGTQFAGHISKGVPNGEGSTFYASGERYSGDFKNGKPHGSGIFTYKDGERYQGSFYKGSFEGQGSFFFKDGSFYIGDFHKNLINGYGTKRYSNGDVYEGEWKNSKQHGTGAMKYANGSKYEGEWKDGKRCGKGIYIYTKTPRVSMSKSYHSLGNISSNSKSEDDESMFFDYGNDETNKMDIIVSDHRYEGMFDNDEINGKGTEYFVDGSRYTGVFKNGMKNGKGKFVDPEGKVFRREYKENEMIYEKEIRYVSSACSEEVVDAVCFVQIAFRECIQ